MHEYKDVSLAQRARVFAQAQLARLKESDEAKRSRSSLLRSNERRWTVRGEPGRALQHSVAPLFHQIRGAALAIRRRCCAALSALQSLIRLARVELSRA